MHKKELLQPLSLTLHGEHIAVHYIGISNDAFEQPNLFAYLHTKQGSSVSAWQVVDELYSSCHITDLQSEHR